MRISFADCPCGVRCNIRTNCLKWNCYKKVPFKILIGISHENTWTRSHTKAIGVSKRAFTCHLASINTSRISSTVAWTQMHTYADRHGTKSSATYTRTHTRTYMRKIHNLKALFYSHVLAVLNITSNIDSDYNSLASGKFEQNFH